MNDSRIDASFNAPGADNRRGLSSQAQRRHWEAAWLDQHRGAFDVIEYEQGEGRPVRDASVATLTGDQLVEQTSRQGVYATKVTHGFLQESSRVSARVHLSTHAGADSAHGLFQDPPVLVTLNSRIQQNSVGGASKTESSPASASPMACTVTPSAVLWLEGESVRSAMRLKDPVRTGETLAALREWLRDAGLWLREAWVNGRIAFKSGRDHGN